MTGATRRRHGPSSSGQNGGVSASAADDLRFAVPLYTAAEAARALDVPATTFATWAKGYVRHPVARSEVHGAPVVTALPAGQVDIVAIAEWLEAKQRRGRPDAQPFAR